MDAVFNPDILFISEEDWKDDIKQDIFLEKLTDILQYIHWNPNIKLLWDDDHERLLWTTPVKRPWKQDRSLGIPLVTILNNFFRSRKDITIVEDSILFEEAKAAPAGNYYPETLRMMHFCIDCNKEIYFVTDNNTPDDIFFHCDCHESTLYPAVVRATKDFCDLDQLVTDFWPENIKEKEKFKRLIEQASETDMEHEIINEYEFADSFMEDIITKNPRKKKLVTQLVKRLQMSHSEAKIDGMIHDEYIKQANEYRIRITQRPTSTRVHYSFGKKNQIIFRHFYDEGEHDDGLR